MRGSRLVFFGDREELVDLFHDFDSLGAHVFWETTSKVNEINRQFSRAPDLLAHSWNTGKGWGQTFLISKAGSDVSISAIHMTDGGTRYAADQARNPHCALIRIGTALPKEILIGSILSANGEDKQGITLFKSFKKAIVKRAKYTNGCYVLPKARERYQSGWRLTEDPEYSEALDFVDR